MPESANSAESEVLVKAKRLKGASYKVAVLPAEARVRLLNAISKALDNNRKQIIAANAIDMKNGEAKGLSKTLLDRLLLNDKRITEMIEGLREVAGMPDKLGNIENMVHRPNGLLIGQMWAPLGVIAIIYEARPNVTVDAASICIKSGNVVLLRGGSEAINSNVVLTHLMQTAAKECGFPEGCIEIIENTDRTLVDELVTLRKYIDVLIPRGSADFIEYIVKIARIPIIETGAGNCHIYIDEEAEIGMAVELVYNGKTSRPSVCNATKKVLVHKSIAAAFLPKMRDRLITAGVEFLTDDLAASYFPGSRKASEKEWFEEFIDMRLGIKIINGLEDAIAHINKYGSHHTDAICTSNYNKALQFIQTVDSASLLWNASTRFTDGGQFGLGAEIGISTQKLHWRGPMSVEQLMCKKFVTLGSGQIRV